MSKLMPCISAPSLYLCQELLVPLVTDTDISMEISGFAALALGLVFTSTCKEVSRGEDRA